MLKPVNDSDRLIAARVGEFLAPNTPWYRSLWNLGTVATLREMANASEAQRAGVLGEHSIRQLASSTTRLCFQDPAVLENYQSLLRGCLERINQKKHLRFEGLDYHTIINCAEQIHAGYLDRWADRIAHSSSTLNPERAARSIAAHLLDKGYSSTFLQKWWHDVAYGGTSDITVSEIVHRAETELAHRQEKEFDVLIAFKQPPKNRAGFPSEWKNGEALIKLLKHHGFETKDVRASGGLLVPVKALDTYAAAEIANEIADHLLARAIVGSTKEIEPWPVMWVIGDSQTHQRTNQRRGVKIRALYRENKVSSPPENSQLDAAIDLLSHLESSPPRAAITLGWAGIEVLLSEPDDRGSAADRLAYLVACSFPRAELTALSYLVKTTKLAATIAEAKTNRDRAAIIAEAIHKGNDLQLKKQSDRAAVGRMERLFADPSRQLDGIRNHVCDAFLRLYRQRNIILHGGQSDPLQLRGTLRTTAKLVGAGIDRIAHYWFVQELKPIPLAARARIAVMTVSHGRSASCVDLLEY